MKITTTNQGPRFQVGVTYTGTFICDSDSHYAIKIWKRTEKSVWIHHPQSGDIVRRSIKISDLNEKEEYILPYGRYSMAPVLRASRPVK